MAERLIDELRGIGQDTLCRLRPPHEALTQVVEALGIEHGDLHVALRRQGASMLPESL